MKKFWIYYEEQPRLQLATGASRTEEYKTSLPNQYQWSQQVIEKGATDRLASCGGFRNQGYDRRRIGGSRKILSDNGMEFKNKVFEEMSKKLRCEVTAYSPLYRPQSNGKIECFHKFSKACMGKHICKNLEWDDVILMATVAYNFFQHTPSKEMPFFLMFGWDLLKGLWQLLGETTRNLGEGDGKLDLTALQNIYQLAAEIVQMAREKSKVDESSIPSAFQPGDLVTLRDHTTKAFDPKYKGEYRVIKF